jgi:phosphopantothenoylcysteine decarboxylase/phosphopantothenate--cysteine ligase
MTTISRRDRRRPLRILLSAGPTREPIDPVRFISNYSTGYMGAQLAREALVRRHIVTVVAGPGTVPTPPSARRIAVERSDEMARAMREGAKAADVVIMAAAVADFRPARRATGKLSRCGPRSIRLVPTPDIIAHLPRHSGQVVAAFAVESSQVVARAAVKLRRKRLDLLVAQQVNGTGAPFGRRSVQAWLLERGGSVVPLGVSSKTRIARVLLDKIEALWYGQPRRATA